MRNAICALFAAIALLALPASGICATTTTELSTEQVQTLTDINTQIIGVHDLVTHNVITTQEGTAAEQFFADKASTVVGHAVTPAEIKTIVANAGKTEGFGTFVSIVIVALGIGVFFSFVGLVAIYFKKQLEQIPPPVYEALAYGTAAFTTFLGYFWGPFHFGPVLVEPLWFAVPGAIGLGACFFLTSALHFTEEGKKRKLSDTVYAGPGFFNIPTVIFGACTLTWGLLAVMFHHIYPVASIPHFLAFGAVVALQAALGFSVLTMPGCVAMGWKEDAQVPKSVFSSLLILLAYIGATMFGFLTGDIALFGPGAAFMGAFVYFLGLLIMASKWYVWADKSRDEDLNRSRYLRVQAVMFASGVAAMYFGSVLHIGSLLGIGGTFFTLWLLEKYYEIKWGSLAGYLWSILILCGIGYFFIGFASTHPQFFIWGIQ